MKGFLKKDILNADNRRFHTDGRRLSAEICVRFARICVKKVSWSSNEVI